MDLTGKPDRIKKDSLMMEFEIFCESIGIEYDFKPLNEYSYFNHETHKAFKLWGYASKKGL